MTSEYKEIIIHEDFPHIVLEQENENGFTLTLDQNGQKRYIITNQIKYDIYSKNVHENYFQAVRSVNLYKKYKFFNNIHMNESIIIYDNFPYIVLDEEDKDGFTKVLNQNGNSKLIVTNQIKYDRYLKLISVCPSYTQILYEP